jgi:hypothetical protein
LPFAGVLNSDKAVAIRRKSSNNIYNNNKIIMDKKIKFRNSLMFRSFYAKIFPELQHPKPSNSLKIASKKAVLPLILLPHGKSYVSFNCHNNKQIKESISPQK